MCHSTVSDVGGVIETAGFRLLENMRAVTMAVSGTRKVACVVGNGANCTFCDFRIFLILILY